MYTINTDKSTTTTIITNISKRTKMNTTTITIITTKHIYSATITICTIYIIIYIICLIYTITMAT